MLCLGIQSQAELSACYSPCVSLCWLCRGMLRENTSDAHKTQSKEIVSNKSCLMWVRVVPQLLATWTAISRGFCEPDTKRYLWRILHERKSMCPIQKLNLYKKGMCALLRKGNNTLSYFHVADGSVRFSKNQNEFPYFLFCMPPLWNVFATRSVWSKHLFLKTFNEGEW